MEILHTQSQDRRTALIQAACEVIAEKGLEGLRIRVVAARVGINPATMYYYFATKEDLIEGVLDHLFSTLGILSEEPAGTPREQLHAHLSRLSRRMRDDPGLFAVLSEMQLRAGRSFSISRFQEYEEKWHRKLENLLQTGIRQGFWPNYLDPDQVATTIILLMQGAALQTTTGIRRIDNSINQLERWLTGR
ncbi:MAG: TetR/AcrR family transcriptional regulator [Leptolinea sp.]|jgi:AcrR family transcriptional regulator|nr:TetR/AcrR family transcriptional regulator [Leptolinea sp.]